MRELDLLNPDLIEIDVEGATKMDILERMAKLFIAKGYVKDSYLEAIKEREKVFPTGIPTEGVGVAIPHADPKHVIKPGIAISILKDPVKFSVMGNPAEEIDVKLVFMLAITDPNMQLKLLQVLAEIFQNKQLLLQLAASKDIEAITELIQNYVNSDKFIKKENLDIA